MFIGRDEELTILENSYKKNTSQLIVIYGRRRIGKSSLLKEFCKNKYEILVEGLEKENTKGQIENFKNQLSKQIIGQALEDTTFKNWTALLNYLVNIIKTWPILHSKKKGKEKLVIVLDEIQWMAVNQSKLISLIKYFWDNHLKDQNVMLILCGSIASFMINNVINSKALYGRINLEINLKGLSPPEIFKLIGNKRNKEETLKYMFVLGGVPKYLEEIDLNKSFEQNMITLFFNKNSLMLAEFERIFYNQFKEAKSYLEIIKSLKDRLLSMHEISEATKIKSGGGLKLYIDNLVRAEFLTPYLPFDRTSNSKFKKYKLTDEYLRFYFYFIMPHLDKIKKGHGKAIYHYQIRPKLISWMAFALENFCLKYSLLIAKKMNFDDLVINSAPYFARNANAFQIDLLFERADKVITLCELKLHNKEIGVEIIPEIERKCKLIKIPRGFSLERALISVYGENKELKNLEYLHHSITIDDIFS